MKDIIKKIHTFKDAYDEAMYNLEDVYTEFLIEFLKERNNEIEIDFVCQIGIMNGDGYEDVSEVDALVLEGENIFVDIGTCTVSFSDLSINDMETITNGIIDEFIDCYDE